MDQMCYIWKVDVATWDILTRYRENEERQRMAAIGSSHKVPRCSHIPLSNKQSDLGPTTLGEIPEDIYTRPSMPIPMPIRVYLLAAGTRSHPSEMLYVPEPANRRNKLCMSCTMSWT